VIATKFGLVTGDGYGGYAISGRPDYVRRACLLPNASSAPPLRWHISLLSPVCHQEAHGTTTTM
jgi:hypothetical protein